MGQREKRISPKLVIWQRESEKHRWTEKARWWSSDQYQKMFSHSSAAPWSGVCSQSSWPRMFNVFLLGSSDDLIVSKLGLWVVTLKLAPNAAWYNFGSLLPVSRSLSLLHYISISMCIHLLQRSQTHFFQNVFADARQAQWWQSERVPADLAWRINGGGLD